MADGVTRTAADWRKKRAVTQKFGSANPPASNAVSGATVSWWPPLVVGATDRSEAGSGADDDEGGSTAGGEVVTLDPDAEHVCVTVGCHRHARLSVQVTDANGPVRSDICCETCFDSNGDGHSPECDAGAAAEAAALRRQRRERRHARQERRQGEVTYDGQFPSQNPTRGGGGGSGGGVADGCVPASVDLGGGAVLGPPDAESDPTGLQALIDANGGPESFKHLRDDERPLGAVLSAREDTSFLKSPYTSVGVPTPGFANTLDLGEPGARQQRLETLACINRSKILSDIPDVIGSAADDISHAVIGVTTTALEQLPERAALAVAPVLDLGGGGTAKVRSFSDEQVRAAVIVALELLMTSSCPKVRRATKKFHNKIVSGALRQDHATDAARAGEQAPPPPADSLDDRAVFWRGPQGADGTYEVRLADGRGGVWVARAKDMGDTIAVNGRQRPKACVVATAAAAAAGDGLEVTPTALLAALKKEALFAKEQLGPLPAEYSG